MNKSSKLHFLFLLILSLNYIIPLIIFGNITLFYPDALESEIVINSFIGEFAKGNFNSIELLTGYMKWDYLRRLFSPIFYLYAFNNEFAYWLVDIILKLTAYISFFVLAKKISKNNFLIGILACLFASTTDQTQFGFGIAITPYLIYLITFRNNIKFKDYLIIIFFALNSDLMTTIWVMPFIFLISYFLNNKILHHRKKTLIKILSLFNLFLFVASANLIFTSIFGEAMHREEYFRTGLPFLENLVVALKDLFRIPFTFDHQIFNHIQFAIFLIPSIIISLIWRDSLSFKFLFLILSVVVFLFVLRTETFVNFQNSSEGLIKSINFHYINICLPLLYMLFLLHICLKKNIFKFLIVPLFTSLIFFQIDSSVVPFVKTYIYKTEPNYKNIYTFKGYYSYDEYLEIKQIIENKRTISIGLNPMIAAINGIKIIDGYYNVYPLSHKKRYRKIIEDEVENNYFLKNNYDEWGNRIMVYFNSKEDPNDNKIKFNEAKKLGVDYVISKYNLQNKSLKIVKKINDHLYLFKII